VVHIGAKDVIGHRTVDQYEDGVEVVKHGLEPSLKMQTIGRLTNAPVRADDHDGSPWNACERQRLGKDQVRIGTLVTPAYQRVHIGTVALVVASYGTASIGVGYLSGKRHVIVDRAVGRHKHREAASDFDVTLGLDKHVSEPRVVLEETQGLVVRGRTVSFGKGGEAFGGYDGVRFIDPGNFENAVELGADDKLMVEAVIDGYLPATHGLFLSISVMNMSRTWPSRLQHRDLCRRDGC